LISNKLSININKTKVVSKIKIKIEILSEMLQSSI